MKVLGYDSIYFESYPWVCLISFWNRCYCLSPSYSFTNYSQISYCGKLLFTHLSFCFHDFAKFSHNLRLSPVPSKMRSPSLSSIPLYSKSFLSLTNLLALLCSFFNCPISLLRCVDQNSTQHLEWKRTKVLHARKIMPSVWLLQYPFLRMLDIFVGLFLATAAH